jgi:hypothetical protein
VAERGARLLLKAMVKRLLPLALAVALAGAPVAIDLCQLTCASATERSAASDAAVRDHACHAHSTPAGTFMSTAPHACRHGDDLPRASSAAPAQSGNAGGPPALIHGPAATVSVPPFALDSCTSSKVLADPLSSRSAIPIRI